jgi:hypothetical protein
MTGRISELINARSVTEWARWARPSSSRRSQSRLCCFRHQDLFLRTLKSLRTFDPGFERASLLEAQLTPQPQNTEKLDAGSYRRQLLEALPNLPSIKSAAFSTLSVPNGDSGWKETISCRI